ncbi:hypothetical protein BpHYR1_052389 [Brachionus plicatilis]|uniref:Uncharacterized protein n=1 Tax=Brachionus plicatilis TaxID=10195 RepID=A0A3M7SWJ7_BRAPC|nr:hypothetical protein BpHYR1_052389 [Brachionus plicatilis]
MRRVLVILSRLNYGVVQGLGRQRRRIQIVRLAGPNHYVPLVTWRRQVVNFRVAPLEYKIYVGARQFLVGAWRIEIDAHGRLAILQQHWLSEVFVDGPAVRIGAFVTVVNSFGRGCVHFEIVVDVGGLDEAEDGDEDEESSEMVGEDGDAYNNFFVGYKSSLIIQRLLSDQQINFKI